MAKTAAKNAKTPKKTAAVGDLFAGEKPRDKKAAAKPSRAASGGSEANYTAKHIEVLEGLEPVRRRPGMYIGGTDEKALHHLFAEAIDNAMDEALAGHADLVTVTFIDGRSTTIAIADEWAPTFRLLGDATRLKLLCAIHFSGQHALTVGELAEATAQGNDAITELVAEEPDLDGMGTTLTAILFAGSRIGLAHIGDSRIYLYRDDALTQITTDHTFVQRLVDSGRIGAQRLMSLVRHESVPIERIILTPTLVPGITT